MNDQAIHSEPDAPGNVVYCTASSFCDHNNIVVRLHGFAATLLALGSLTLACRRTDSPGRIDTDLAACVPADTIALAGLNLDEIRASPLFRRTSLPALESLREASQLLATSNGKEFLLIVRGRFSQPPLAGIMIAPAIALAGSPDMIRAATAQHRSGRTGAPGLLARASRVAASGQIWAIVPGGIDLPFSGNAANLNRLFRSAEYVTFAAKIDQGVDLDLTGQCRSADDARQLEETLRAVVSLAAVANSRQADVAAIFDCVRIRREDLLVHATLSAAAEPSGKLLGALPWLR